MRFLFIFTSFLLPMLTATSSQAAKPAYEIDAKVFVNGSLVSSPKIITQDGRAAEIQTVNEFPPGTIKVKALPRDTSTRDARKNVQLNMEIGYKNGSQDLKYTPEIKTKLGTEVTAIQKDKDGNEQMKIVLTVKTARVYEDGETPRNGSTGDTQRQPSGQQYQDAKVIEAN
jgi:hypothetical protein